MSLLSGGKTVMMHREILGLPAVGRCSNGLSLVIDEATDRSDSVSKSMDENTLMVKNEIKVCPSEGCALAGAHF